MNKEDFIKSATLADLEQILTEATNTFISIEDIGSLERLADVLQEFIIKCESALEDFESDDEEE